MNFKKLNKLIFTKENSNNDYVRWDIGKETTSPRYIFENVKESGYRHIIQAKSRLDEIVYQAVFEYVNTEDLCNSQEGMFPRNDCMTGNYYVAEEYYSSCGNVIQGNILTHFTEMFCGGVITVPSEQDYLGLEVHFIIHNDGNIEIIGIDSSSI